MSKSKKFKIAIFELTSCAGCEVAILEQGERFLEFLNQIELVEFRLMEEKIDKSRFYDAAFIIGSPLTRHQLNLVKEIRRKAKFLVACGNCTILGGIPKIKNYRGKEKVIKYVYEKPKRIDNFDVRPLAEIVKVDAFVPACPLDGKEFLKIAYNLINERLPKIIPRPVCYECQINEYECLLQKGEPCLGPATLGGCDAICLKSKMPCEGCRGLYSGANLKSLFEKIKEKTDSRRLEEILEIFGIKDSFKHLDETL